MSALVISNATPFGSATNQTVAALYALDEAITRLQAAMAVAASGYGDTPGTEYEEGSNFGVASDPMQPGKNGQDYAYAVDQLHNKWVEFWAQAKAYAQALDNGVRII